MFVTFSLLQSVMDAAYIEFYNTQRPHRTLKNLTPCQVEDAFMSDKSWIRIPVTQLGGRFHRLRVLRLDFALFAFVWWHSALYNRNARNHCGTMVSGIKWPYLFWTLTSFCSDQVGSFTMVRVAGFEPTASWSRTTSGLYNRSKCVR